MHFPKLTPLQSRFAASLTASLILVILYLSITHPQFAYASDADSVAHIDHNHPLSFELNPEEDVVGFILDENASEDEVYEETGRYEAEFAGLSRGIDGRAPPGVTALSNNDPKNLDISQGKSQSYVFPSSALWGSYAPTSTGLPSPVKARWLDTADGKDLLNLEEDLESDMAWNIRWGGNGPLDKRQDEDGNSSNSSRTVYITLNACLQPSATDSRNYDPPPQLQLFATNTSANEHPGPKVTTDNNQINATAYGGFAEITFNATSDVYISVVAPTNSSYSGIWNYDVAVSIDAPYHSVELWRPNLHLVDSDTYSALLITDNLTETASDSPIFQAWNRTAPPFVMFANNVNETKIRGLEHSYCGLKHNAEIAGIDDGQGADMVTSGMTLRGLGNKPKEQFYIQGLKGHSTYHGILAMQGNSTKEGAGVVGGGGKVWQTMNFTTMTDGNCQVIFNLSFCSEVAYAVPSNPKTYPNIGVLTELYDTHAASLFKNFSYSLQQTPCNTTSSAQYSLARDCDDCSRDYKTWLCAVTIPRCADFSSDLPFLQPRNVAQRFINGTSLSPSQRISNASSPSSYLSAIASSSATAIPGSALPSGSSLLSLPSSSPVSVPPSTLPGTSNSPFGYDWYAAVRAALYSVASNSSRNPLIDEMIQPGPYKEILPCEDLCYSIVQSCPASLGFGCPLRKKGLEVSYGMRNDRGVITCSYLGAAYYLNAAEARFGSVRNVVGIALIVMVFMGIWG
ncbi:hypothetical protein L228DRAFT_267984 [Xylona heveae TC161]|uniref:FZ domain-containing protein n=1 Tax=Xylona heveae (strain CBS 132557 / TC161) TaxID=1328760 RepID=A0A165GTY9_XYLHT|nr:hypothetical protein L228DRAFT_267984 [Xylona heveae TC161]KZF22595.1 hypothetical protein L228DRAFT_267984 [Xylona heveae TC161]